MNDNQNTTNTMTPPKNAVVSLEFTARFLGAKIFIAPPENDGAHISVSDIEKKLREHNVSYGVNTELINQIAENHLYNTWHTIAEGTAPVDGTDGKITYHFKENVENVPKEDKRGFVDYKELGIVRNVEAGTVLATLVAPTLGIMGKNVQNKEVPAKNGVRAIVNIGNNIVYSEDKLSLLVAKNGNLTCKNNKWSVDTTFSLDGNVDISSGNIDFIGELIIKGDVTEGFSVSGREGVTIYGTVVRATVKSDSDVVIKQGAIGSTITAKGSLSVNFAESSVITCSNSLKTSSLMFCEVFCDGEIDVSSGNGLITGGRITSTKNIDAKVIGSKNFVPTNIIVGNNAILTEEKNKIIEYVNTLDVQIEDCTKIVSFLTALQQANGPLSKEKNDIFVSAEHTQKIDMQKKLEALNRIAEIDLILETKQVLFIKCRSELFPGVKATINNDVITVKDEYTRCLITLVENEIRIAPI